MTSTTPASGISVSRQHAVVRSILTIAEIARARLARGLEPAGITLQQFSVLRILADSGDAGLPTLVIADRLVERAPGVTRLMDRLESQGLVRRERGADRRQVICALTEKGAMLVRELNPGLSRAEEEIVASLNPNELGAIQHFLHRIRSNLEAP